MLIINLYADLQANPRSKETYRKIKEYYESLGMKNESEAFEELIERKFNVDNTSINKK